MKKYLSWCDYNEIIKNIIDYFKDKHIEKVVGIYKGGLVPAVQIANALKVPLDIVAFQHHDGNDKEAKYILNTGAADNVLIVDDIIDSGKTINKVLKLIRAENIFVTAIDIKDKSLPAITNIKLFAPYLDTSDDWIVFPWET